ncbi:hypothetical protein ACFO72_004580 [Enterobacter roggenkampii]
MSREDVLDRVLLSHYFEEMFSTSTGRIDRLLSFLSLFIGSSIVADTGSPVWSGISIAMISALQMTFQFGKSSEHSRKQAKQHQVLFTTAFKLSDDELFNKMLEIEDGDFEPWAILHNPAMLRTRIHLSVAHDQHEQRLNLIERITARIAGGPSKRPRAYQPDSKKPTL